MNDIYKERAKEYSLLQKLANHTQVNVDADKISDADCRKLFTLIINQYKENKLSGNELSALCELVYGKLSTDSKLYDLLQLGAEIGWYLKHQPNLAEETIDDLTEEFSSK